MRKTILLSVLTALTFSSCEKEVVGAKGEQGIQGQKGNVNVIASNEVTISDWEQDGNSWYTNIKWDAITQDIVNTGKVTVFIKYGSEWWALPDLDGKNSTQYGFGVGYVNLYNSNNDYTLPSSPSPKTFRVVAIPSSGLAEHPNTNWNNYKEVSELL